jgi:hypothetical protein
METNFAYTSGDKKLFPLCYIEKDGSVNRAKTVALVTFALDTFSDVAPAHIPARERDNVRHQIEGAAQSLGILL